MGLVSFSGNIKSFFFGVKLVCVSPYVNDAKYERVYSAKRAEFC